MPDVDLGDFVLGCSTSSLQLHGHAIITVKPTQFCDISRNSDDTPDLNVADIESDWIQLKTNFRLVVYVLLEGEQPVTIDLVALLEELSSTLERAEACLISSFNHNIANAEPDLATTGTCSSRF